MEINILQHKVRHGDTLQSIAIRAGITSEELKLFHNSHCQKTERIWFDSLNEVKIILVPTAFKTERQKEDEKKKILPSQEISSSFFAKTYTVTENFESPFESSLTIDYTVNIKIRKEKNQNILSYSQDHFKVHGENPEDKISELSIACMKSIMPIDFMMNEQGKITAFTDHRKILQTFSDKRKDLDFFAGEISERYMDKFEKNISDEIFFLRQLQSTLLFQVIFPKLEWFHKKTEWTESFYFSQNSFPVPCNMEIKQENEDLNHITTILTGRCTEFYSLQELRTGTKYNEPADDPVSGTIIIEYTTHKKNKNLVRASVTLALWREEESIQQQTLTITQG